MVLDTNLVVLLIVGLTKTAYIARHKRLRAYDLQAFELLVSMLPAGPQLILTPNVLSEASNLLRQIEEPFRSEVCRTLGFFVQNSCIEEYRPSRLAVVDRKFARLGLTDAVILGMLTDRILLLTADLDLYLEAGTRGMHAVNFNHVREAARSS